MQTVAVSRGDGHMVYNVVFRNRERYGPEAGMACVRGGAGDKCTK